MAQSALECANAALIKLGNSTISSLSDTSKEATTCNARIDVVKKALLRAHPWNFAINRTKAEAVVLTISVLTPASDAVIDVTGAADHGLVAGDWVYIDGYGPVQVVVDLAVDQFSVDVSYTDLVAAGVEVGDTCWKSVASDWAYLLTPPTSWLRILGVTNGTADVDYRMEAGGIATNSDTVYVKYIKDVTDYTLMDTLFYEALSAYLAWDICFQITQSNELKDQLWKDYRAIVAQAKFVDATEDAQQSFDSNNWIESRSETLGS